MTTDTNRVALITGASSGIGKAVARKLAHDGFAVGIHYSQNWEGANQLVLDVTESAGRAVAVQADIGDEIEMRAAFDKVEESFGGIDVVVNSAGIMTLGPIVDYDLGDFDRIVRTNLRGSFIATQEAARRVRPGGAIINFSTSVTRTQFPNYGPYIATKAATEALTLVLARELRGKDITVNTIAPGPTETPLFLNGKSKEAVQASANAAPLERLGQPSDIAEAVAFLAGPARWVNGQTIFVNGGLA